MIMMEVLETKLIFLAQNIEMIINLILLVMDYQAFQLIIDLNKQVNNSELLFGYCESDNLTEKVSLSEFNAIMFDNHVPNFAVDLIKYITGHDMFKQSGPPPVIIPNFEVFDDKLTEIRKQLGDEDYDCCIRGFKLFYANPECLLDSQWYITKDSINSNFSKVFGEFNQHFANLFFYYLTDGSELERIPLYNFVKNMSPFLSNEKIVIMDKIFKFYDLNHDGVISIVELLQAQASIPCDTQFSQEIGSIIDIYVNDVLLAKRRRIIFDINSSTFEMFLKTSCIASEIISKIFKRSTKGWPTITLKSIFTRSFEFTEQEYTKRMNYLKYITEDLENMAFTILEEGKK